MLSARYAAPSSKSSNAIDRVALPLRSRSSSLDLVDPARPSLTLRHKTLLSACMSLAFPPLRFARGTVLRRINKLTDFRSLLLNFRQVLLVHLLIDLQLLLRGFLLPGAHVSLPQPVVGIGKTGIQFQGPNIFRNGLGILALVRVKIAQLQVRIGQFGIELQGLFENRFDLMEIQAWIFGAF